MPSSRPLTTIGVIANHLGVGVHRIRYIIETRHIRPAGRAGNARVFADADVNRIRAELNRIAVRNAKDIEDDTRH